jgi:hypothetical protein
VRFLSSPISPVVTSGGSCVSNFVGAAMAGGEKLESTINEVLAHIRKTVRAAA